MNNYCRILFTIVFIVINNNITAKTYQIENEPDNNDNNQFIYINTINNEFNDLELSKKIDSIRKQGYFKVEIIEKIRLDSLNYKVKIDLNQKFENIYLYDESLMLNFKNKKLKIIDDKTHYQIKINQLEEFLTKSSEVVADKGYPFNKIKLINIRSYDRFN